MQGKCMRILILHARASWNKSSLFVQIDFQSTIELHIQITIVEGPTMARFSKISKYRYYYLT